MVLDEVQHVNGWERFASRMRASKKMIVTGSSSQLLSSELATLLTGRHVDFMLFPFNFREFLKIRGVELDENWQYSTAKVSTVKSMLEEYLRTGGFPEASRFGRHRVKKTAALKEFARYMVSNVSSEFSFNRLRRVLGVSDVHTVRNYAEWVGEAYLLFFLERFSPKLKLQYISPKKAYCVDNGIVTSIGFRISENLGGLMENLVAVELLRRRSYSFSDFEVFYWRDYQQNEVDFVVKNGLSIKQLIQVAYASGRDEVNSREVKALLKTSKELHCRDLLVITWDYEDEAVSNGEKVRYVPLWKWLLIH
jgi:predicted AAA+ superfamily ATPase